MPSPSNQRRHGLELGLILLVNDLLQYGMQNIPPVTLSSIIGQTLIYMGIIQVPWTKEEACVSGYGVLIEKEWHRIILSALEHGDDMHLYYNMASYLIKGRSLEKRYGSISFAAILVFLTIVTGSTYVLLAFVMSELMENQQYMRTCAIGFSGVIFSLKVLTTNEEPYRRASVAGVQMPGKYAAWIELCLIHMLVPNSSFLGHLAGILAGIFYCNTPIGKLVDYALECFTGQPIVHGYRDNHRYCANCNYGAAQITPNLYFDPNQQFISELYDHIR